jgi:hypothetical protein
MMEECYSMMDEDYNMIEEYYSMMDEDNKMVDMGYMDENFIMMDVPEEEPWGFLGCDSTGSSPVWKTSLYPLSQLKGTV